MKTWVLTPTWDAIQMTAKTVIFFLTFERAVHNPDGAFFPW